MNLVRALHQAAGHDDADHARASSCSARWRTGCCRSATCRPSTSPPSRCSAGLPGASPETMASAVALPLEKQFATIAGLNSINSTSSQGSTNITLQFDLSRNIDAAAQDVQAMIAKAARQLPPQMPAPPSYQKVNPGDQPVLFLVLHSRDAAAVDRRRVRADDDRAAHLDGQRRRAGATSSARRSTRCASTSIRASWRRTASASTRWPTRSRTPTSTCRPARCTAPTRPSSSRPTASCCAPTRYGPTIIAYRNGNPVRLERGRARLRRRRERQDGRLVQRRAAPIYLADPEAARHQRRRGRRRGQGAAADVPRAAAGRRVARRPHRPLAGRSASRCTT